MTIRKQGLSLKNAYITGDLFITEGVCDGDINLEALRISGRLLAAGGGENSIYVKDITVGRHVVADKPPVVGEQSMRFRAVQTNDMTIIFEGVVREVVITEDIIIFIDNDGEMTVFNFSKPDFDGAKPTLIISEGASVDKIVADVPSVISGSGGIDQIDANTGGIEISKDLNVKPEDVNVSDGVHIIKDDENALGTGTGETRPPVSPPSGGGSGGGAGYSD